MSELDEALYQFDVMVGESRMPDSSNLEIIVKGARAYANGEFLWICEYPEFADPGCLVDHKAENTRQPRKHSECRWVVACALPGETEGDAA